MTRHVIWGMVGGLALLHALIYAWLIPPWQIPDEPSQFEYAALIAARGRVPAAGDSDPALDARLLVSMLRAQFFEYVIGKTPEPLPQTMADARALFFMPSQLGADPPLYFALAALPIRLLADRPIETQLLAVRLLGALCCAGAALCAYQAGGELAGRWLALTAGLTLALQPMFMFIGVGAGDDTLANLLGAALTWALLRTARRGVSPRRLALLGLLALLGIASKRTFLPWLLVLALLGLGLALRGLRRLPIGQAQRLGLLLALLLGSVGLLAGALAAGRDPRTARDWYDSTAFGLAQRVHPPDDSERYVLAVRAGANAVQPVPPVAMEWAQNQEFELTAQVWAPDGARGHLFVDYGWARVELPFEAGATPQIVRLSTFLPLYCPGLLVGLVAEQGTIYAGQLAATSARDRRVAMLNNGDLALPGIHDGSLQARLTGYLRLRELAWGWRSGWLSWPPPLGWALGRVFFASMWGQFSWMSLLMVLDTEWEHGLGLLIFGGLLGALVLTARAGWPRWRRLALLLLLALPPAGLLFPLLNAYTQPRGQLLQQGRYIFPMLLPLLLAVLLGWRAWLPPRWRAGALLLWFGWWLVFAGAALAQLVKIYRPDLM